MRRLIFAVSAIVCTGCTADQFVDLSDAAPADVGSDATKDPCADAGAHRFIFATRSTTNGSFGGRVGANALCNAAAHGNLPGNYEAWVSTTTSSPSLTVDLRPDSAVVLPTCDVVATSLAQMASGLLKPIDVDEFGVSSAGTLVVWSRTTPTGALDQTATGCADWASEASNASGSLGAATAITSPTWSDNPATTQTCDKPARLYCIQD